MEEKENSTSSVKSKSKKKIIILSIIAVVVLLLVVTVLILPSILSTRSGEHFILSKINDSVPGQVKFADLSVGWFSGVKVSDIHFKDLSGLTSVTVRQLTAEPHYLSLLSGTMAFGKTVVDDLNVDIQLPPRELMPPATAAAGESESKEVQDGRITIPLKTIDFKLNNGTVRITDAQNNQVALKDIHSALNLHKPGTPSGFTVQMNLADTQRQTPIEAAGDFTTAPAKKGWDLKQTSGDFSVRIDTLNLKTLEPILALAGIEMQAAGTISADVNSSIEKGKLTAANAVIDGQKLNIQSPALGDNALKTENLAVRADMKSQADMMDIQTLSAQADWFDAQVTGTLPTSPKAWTNFLKPDSQGTLNGRFNLNLAAAMSQMPKLFKLKEGTNIRTGSLTGQVETAVAGGKRILTATASLADLAGVFQQKPVALSEPIGIDLRISSDAAGMTIEKATITSSFTNFSIAGDMNKLDYRFDADLEDMQIEVGQFVDFGPYLVKGTAVETGVLSIEEDHIEAVGQAEIRQFGLTGPNGVFLEPTIAFDYAMGFKPSIKQLNISKFITQGSFGNIKIADAVFGGQVTSADIITNLDLQRVQAIAELFTDGLKDMKLAGKLSSTVSLQQKQSMLTVATDDTMINDLKVTYPQKTPFEDKRIALKFEGAFDTKAKSVNIKNLQLDSTSIDIQKGKFTQQTTGGQTQIKGDLQCRYDWKSVTDLTSGYLPEGLTLEGQREDRITFQSQYPAEQPGKLMQNLAASAKLGFDKAHYFGLNFGKTEVPIVAEKGILSVGPFTSPVNGGQINFAANADFNRDIPLFTIPQAMDVVNDVQLNDTMAQLLKYANPIFANALDLGGVGNLQCQMLSIPLSTQAIDDIEIDATVSLDNMRMKSRGFLALLIDTLKKLDDSIDPTDKTIRLYPSRFVAKDGVLSYDNMRVDVAGVPMRFEGMVELAARQYKNTFLVLPYTSRGQRISLDEPADGKPQKLPITGPVNQPKLEVGALVENVINDAIRDKIKDELGGALEDLFKK